MTSSKLAAPMVADPAGVTVKDIAISFRSIERNLRKLADRLPMFSGGAELDDSIGTAARRAQELEQVAATVKAVPSEALEADAILESAAKIADAEMIPTNILSDQWDHGYFAGAGTVAALIRASKSSKIVAPLADKTGGGE